MESICRSMDVILSEKLRAKFGIPRDVGCFVQSVGRSNCLLSDNCTVVFYYFRWSSRDFEGSWSCWTATDTFCVNSILNGTKKNARIINGKCVKMKMFRSIVWLFRAIHFFWFVLFYFPLMGSMFISKSLEAFKRKWKKNNWIVYNKCFR